MGRPLHRSDRIGMTTEQECLYLANKLIVRCQLQHPRVNKISAISSQLFMLLFKACCGVEVPGAVENPSTQEEEACNIGVLLDVLSRDVLFLSLAHIDGRDVVTRNLDAIYDLLEIMEGCLDVRHASSSAPSSPTSSASSSGWLTESSSSATDAPAPSSRSSRTTSSQFSTYRSSLCSLDSSTTTSCFVCDYVAAKDRAETNRSTDRLEGTSVRKPGTAHITDVMEAYKHSDAFWQTAVKSSMCVPEPKPQEQQHSYLRYGSPSSVHERRRRSTGSPYWLRSGASAEPSQEEVSGEQIASTVAELRQLVAASEATRQDGDGLGNAAVGSKRLRMVRKSVLLPHSQRPVKRAKAKTAASEDAMQCMSPCLISAGQATTVTPGNTNSTEMSPHAERLLHKLHEQHVRFATRTSGADAASDLWRLQRKQAQLLKRHALKVDQMRRDFNHAQRKNELDATRQIQHATNVLEHERRLRRAQVKRHHDERERILRSRRLSQRHREQQVLHETFKASLENQKADLHEVRQLVRERQMRECDAHRVHLASLENFYQSQLALLTESLSKEKQEMRQRAEAQAKVLEKMRREFKGKLEEETRNMYDLVYRSRDGWVTSSQPVPSRKRIRPI